MSRCWYCNNELTTGDSPKHFGICNKCYDEMFKSGDIIIHSLTNKITELQKQLEEKEKDNQFLKKMYLSEKQKNDNYRTEKYGLDKPIEELKKIKLNPKEKEIYYKGFDNCERQFATHITELQQQIEEKEKSLEYFRDRDEKGSKEIKDNYKKYNQLVNEYNDLMTKLKSQPAEIVEKIKKQLIKRLNTIAGYGRMTTDELSFFIETEFGSDLDTILKEYQKES